MNIIDKNKADKETFSRDEVIMALAKVVGKFKIPFEYIPSKGSIKMDVSSFIDTNVGTLMLSCMVETD